MFFLVRKQCKKCVKSIDIKNKVGKISSHEKEVIIYCFFDC